MFDLTNYHKIFIQCPASEGGGYVALVEELPGCITQGETLEGADLMLRGAATLWADSTEASGRAVPPARDDHLIVTAAGRMRPPDDRERGIYRKYFVERLNDPTRKHGECPFFVLDLAHDPFAIPAVLEYATACKEEYPKLASDLRRLVAGETPKGLTE